MARQQTIDLARLGVAPGEPIIAGVHLPVETVPPLPGYLRLATTAPGVGGIDVFLTGPIVPTGDSYESGFEIIEREQRLAATVWRGTRPLQLACPVLLDGTARGRPVRTAWARLVGLGRPRGGRKPPRVQASGPIIHPTVKEWWVAGITVQGDPVWDEQGRLLRIEAVVTLLQATEVDPLEVQPPVTARSLPATVTTRRGDTLRRIARRLQASEAGERRTVQQLIRAIRAANGQPGVRGKLRDPDAELPAGLRLRMPS